MVRDLSGLHGPIGPAGHILTRDKGSRIPKGIRDKKSHMLSGVY